MLSYSEIVKKAYGITTKQPVLWLFGLFVVGGFNLNFLNYENIPLRRLTLEARFLEGVNFFLSHPGALALACLSLLIFALGGLLISNWSRVMLILLGEAALKKPQLELDEQLKKSSKSFWTVVRISLLTSSLIVVVALGLFLPFWFLAIDPDLRSILLFGGILILLPLVFTISCINIFTTYYAVVYNKPLSSALNLGTDLFVSRWTQILGLTLLLMVIYLGAFALGVGLIFLARLLFGWLFGLLNQFNILSFSAIIMGLKFVSNMLLWILLAGLSVFFNQALLILFLELNGPVKRVEPAAEPKIVPAASSS